MSLFVVKDLWDIHDILARPSLSSHFHKMKSVYTYMHANELYRMNPYCIYVFCQVKADEYMKIRN